MSKDEMQEQVVDKKKNKIVLFAGILGVLLLVVLGVVITPHIISANKDRKVNEQLEEAQHFLDDLDYEQAIVAYEAVIEIDPMSVEAYLGLADVYVKSDDLDKAIEVLQSGYSATGDERLRSKLDELELLKQTEESIESESSEIVHESKTYDYADATNATIGDYVIMGRYEQDNDLSNGAEPIEWVVIEKTDGKMLLVSRYVLDVIPYHHTYEDITWAECSLRAWLNADFYESSFDLNEQEKIVSTYLSTSGDSNYGTIGGSDTQDKVFLLSIEDVINYFDVYLNGYYAGESLIVAGTSYAINKGNDVGTNFPFTKTFTQEDYQHYVKYWESSYSENSIGKTGCNWSLRSPGYSQDHNLVVGFDGFIFGSVTCEVNATDNGVRPAIWVAY